MWTMESMLSDLPPACAKLPMPLPPHAQSKAARALAEGIGYQGPLIRYRSRQQDGEAVVRAGPSPVSTEGEAACP